MGPDDASDADRARDASVADAYEDELARWAAFVHREPLQQLSAVGIRLQLVRAALANGDVGATERDDVDEMLEAIRTTAEQLRTLQFELHPAAFASADLTGALRDLVAHGAAAGAPVSFVDAPVPAVLPAAMRAAFRVVQLVLHRATHADACTVLLAPDPAGVRVTIAVTSADAARAGGVLDEDEVAGSVERLAAVGGSFAVELDDDVVHHLRIPAAPELAGP